MREGIKMIFCAFSSCILLIMKIFGVPIYESILKTGSPSCAFGFGQVK